MLITDSLTALLTLHAHESGKVMGCLLWLLLCQRVTSDINSRSLSVRPLDRDNARSRPHVAGRGSHTADQSSTGNVVEICFLGVSGFQMPPALLGTGPLPPSSKPAVVG